MYGDDSAIAFVFKHKHLAPKASTWDSFCDMAKADGDKLADHYRDYKWLPQFYKSAKHHQELKYLPKALYAPEATCLSDIFTGIEYRKTAPKDNGRRESGYFISSPLSASRGRHTYDPGRDVVTLHSPHYWCAMYATGIKPAIRGAVEPGMIGEIGSFEIIEWQDGRYLDMRRDNHGIGSRWLAILPAGYDFLQDIPPEDREYILADRAAFDEAIKDAPATSMYKTRANNGR